MTPCYNGCVDTKHLCYAGGKGDLRGMEETERRTEPITVRLISNHHQIEQVSLPLRTGLLFFPFGQFFLFPHPSGDPLFFRFNLCHDSSPFPRYCSVSSTTSLVDMVRRILVMPFSLTNSWDSARRRVFSLISATCAGVSRSGLPSLIHSALGLQ